MATTMTLATMGTNMPVPACIHDVPGAGACVRNVDERGDVDDDLASNTDGNDDGEKCKRKGTRDSVK